MLLRALLLFVTLVSAAPVHDIIIEDSPTVEDGAAVARTLVNRESLANVNTIKPVKRPDGTVLNLPVSSIEYYADCDNDGDPYWLVIDIGGPNQNIIKGSPYSFTIRVGDHAKYDEDVNDEYPGGLDGSVAGSPRVQLTGTLRAFYFDNPFDPKKLELEKCFLKRHPDASAWLPNNYLSPHKSHWAKFKVDGAYLIGGFGGRAYIGDIDSDLYHAAEIIE
ncbi:hypothetical protein Cantr_09373 [Candida viswanathii]|uniref:CREG-like beta-barrel domain-containing protein n=1 Tax=Candida viswanathii TaxID=5486 RepID=A0A367Y8W8_9ASCO|nr:hypothetical protein Cantr_09373 [Candida viswanathii]